MAGHIIEHCKKPRLWYRRYGSLWMCDCGKLYKVTPGYYKVWELVSNPEKEYDKMREGLPL